MAGKWGILAFNAMDRLEPTPSKAKYLVMVREHYIEMMFPVYTGEEIMVAVVADSKSEASEIYELVYSFLSRELKVTTRA
jgi:hypothetical protein